MSDRTPLEETFDLPSLNDITKAQTFEDNQEVDYNEYEDLDEIDNLDNITMSEEDMLKNIQDYSSAIKEVRQVGISNTASYSMKEYMSKMEDVHTKALDNFEDLMKSIMSMEAGVGAKYLVSAVKLLDIAKDAQNTSMDRVIRMERLHIEREKHDADMEDLIKRPKSVSDGGDIIESNYGEEADDAVYIVEENRNTILQRRRAKLLEQQKSNKED